MKCCVTGCPNNSSFLRSKSFFRFPQNDELQVKWIQAIGRSEFVPNKYSVVCADHFSPRDVLVIGTRKHLRPEAIPSINIEGHGATTSTCCVAVMLPEMLQCVETRGDKLKVISWTASKSEEYFNVPEYRHVKLGPENTGAALLCPTKSFNSCYYRKEMSWPKGGS